MKKELTPKQERFCREYVIDLNGLQAALRCNYSKKTAQQQASRLLLNVKVQEFIKQLQDNANNKLEIKQEYVLSEILKISHCNIQDYIKAGFEIEDIVNLKRDQAAAIESIQVTTTIRGSGENMSTEKVVKFKLYDKIKALDMLSKHTGIFEKDNEQARASVIFNVIATNPKQLDTIKKIK